VDDRLFRDAMGKFATGVTVLTTINEDEPHGMTANGFMSVSLAPKLVVISIGHKARFLEKVQRSGVFAVNILAADQQHYSKIFAGQQEGQIEFNELAGLPVLDGALAQVACKVIAEHLEGDHTLFIGEVLEIHLSDGQPLLFFGGKYRSLAEIEVVENL
jgi:flavin reductase (DIM6/NTAB) family NADH-FMN oxidoreductase RutF